MVVEFSKGNGGHLLLSGKSSGWWNIIISIWPDLIARVFFQAYVDGLKIPVFSSPHNRILNEGDIHQAIDGLIFMVH